MTLSLVTTFNAAGYELYAKKMLQSFIKNWPKEVTLYAYAEECEVVESADNLVCLNLNDASPELLRFKQNWQHVPKANGNETRLKGFKWDAIRFSHKVYAIFHAAKTCPTDGLLWVDADTLFHSPISLMELLLFCPQSVDIAYLGRNHMYSECGLYYMNLNSKSTGRFLNTFQDMYDNAEEGIFALDEWHDSFVFDAVCKKIPELKLLNWSNGLEGKVEHPLVNTFWGGYLDHLKGARKSYGRSKNNDLVVHRKELYWNSFYQPDVTIYIPRLDLPWKQPKVEGKYSLLSEGVIDMRLQWKAFVTHLANRLVNLGLIVNIDEMPAWEITRAKVEFDQSKLAIIPHKCKYNFEEGSTPVLFYMQEFYSSVFVVNQHGWSAASSYYPMRLDNMETAYGDSYSVYRKRLETGVLVSKFSQSASSSLKELLQSNEIPSIKTNGSLKQRQYIFFPLQVPHDESIKYFSNVSELAVVKAVVAWANRHDICIVLKPHPANPAAMQQFMQFVDNKNIFSSNAHVYDLIRYSKAVYTINSGVGFEALLHRKPVVTFGRVEYDCVTFNATTSAIGDAYKYCKEIDVESMEAGYRKFINWFLGNYAVDMSQPTLASKRFEDIASSILTSVKEVNA